MAVTTTTLAIASIASTLVSTAMSFYGQQQQAKAAEAQGKYQMAVARNNQILAERAARDSEARGKLSERRTREQTRQLIGRQRAALAGMGVEVDEGSALDLTTDTAEIGELDALIVRSNFQREAYQYRAQGANAIAQGQLAQFEGLNRAAAYRSSSYGTLVDGIGTVASKWYNYKS